MERMLVVALVMVLISLPALGQGAPAAAQGSTSGPKGFSEKDAVQVMDGLRKAFESNNRKSLIGMFDAARMPGFAAFRDQLRQFLAQYEGFQVRYHVNQVAQDGEFGSIVSEFMIEGLAVTNGLPDVRRRAQMRLIVAWDGKSWKITDLTPRSLFD